MKGVLIFFEGLIFLQFTIWVLYFLVYAIFYRIPRRIVYPPASGKHRYLVVFPAYKEDTVIIESIASFLRQTYSRSDYEIVVVADSMQETTNNLLREQGATVLVPHFERRSKAAALNLSVQYAAGKSFDAIVILDADNIVNPDFLEKVNDAFSTGLLALQAHRVAKNENTDMAYLDGISEEINNSIFRQGHVNAGLPAALTGSGMIFDFGWFRTTIPKISSMGEDKELEFYLLNDRIYTEYLEHVYVLDEKVQNRKDFSNQRKRWIAAQIDTFILVVKQTKSIITTRNWALLDKLVQWSIPPRILLLGLILVWTLILFFTNSALCWKWLILYIVYLAALCLAVPNRFYTRRSWRAFLKLPFIFIVLLRSFMGIKSARKTFLHTPHGERKEDNSN